MQIPRGCLSEHCSVGGSAVTWVPPGGSWVGEWENLREGRVGQGRVGPWLFVRPASEVLHFGVAWTVL